MPAPTRPGVMPPSCSPASNPGPQPRTCSAPASNTARHALLHKPRPASRRLAFARRAACLWLLAAPAAHAGLGVTEIAGSPGDGPVTVFYATDTADRPWVLAPGQLQLSVARDATPRTRGDGGDHGRGPGNERVDGRGDGRGDNRGDDPRNAPGVAPEADPAITPAAPVLPANGRLVVVSHGSGGSPWVHADLARRLVEAGFVVAMPWHRGDNVRDDGEPGPVSWARRPSEVSRAIDAVGRDPRFAATLRLDRVGVYGQSAGGHTALSMAGGAWSPARFRDHCQAHIGDDFNACVGLATRLTGGWADGLKRWLAVQVLNSRFGDASPQRHHDPRVAAVVAGNPASADFDPTSLANPPVALGLVTTRGDRWLQPRFHGDRILAACRPRCEWLADLPTGGHGALLSPLPAGLDGLLGDLLNDPPGFDRATAVPAVEAQIVDFMRRHLATSAAPAAAAAAAGPGPVRAAP